MTDLKTMIADTAKTTRNRWIIGMVVLMIAGVIPFSCYLRRPGEPYRYDHMNIGGNVLPVRINNRTGATEILYPEGWRSVDGNEFASKSARSALPADALSRISVKCRSTGYGYLEAETQNDSDWTLSRLTVNVSITDRSGGMVIRDRQYVLSGRNGTGAPGTSSRFSEKVYLTLEPGQQLTGSLVGAEGTK